MPDDVPDAVPDDLPEHERDAAPARADSLPIVVTRVVLVDDVPQVRRLVRTALRFSGGFDVVGEAGDGSEALRLVADLRPDILVLDLGLPDIAGREVLTRVREQSPGTRIVVFSGTVDPPDREWIDERVAGYALKDADLDLLVDLLRTVSDRRDVAVCDLPQDLVSARTARHFLRETLENWTMPGAGDAAELVVSELVTNAVTHAASACQLRLARTVAGLRIEVADGGAGTPDPQPPSATGLHGRGMHIVAALAVAWGTELLATGGKLVWAELPAQA